MTKSKKDKLQGLTEKLKKMKSKSVDIDYKKELEDWTQDVHNLLFKIIDWLRPFELKGLLDTHCEKVTVIEPRICEYLISMLSIFLPDNSPILIKPHALFVIGAKGCVHITRGPKKILLLRQDKDEWMMSYKEWDSPGIHFERGFDKDSFLDLLNDLVDPFSDDPENLGKAF